MPGVEVLPLLHGLAAAGAWLADGRGEEPGSGGLVLGAVAALGGVAAAGVALSVPCGGAGLAAVVGPVGEPGAGLSG